MTRSRRKSAVTPQETTQDKTKTQEKIRRPPARKSKVLEDVEANAIEELTPKRAPRRPELTAWAELNSNWSYIEELMMWTEHTK